MLLMAASAASAGVKDVAPSGPGDNCVSCHDRWTTDTTHAPVAAGLCAACHRAASATRHAFEFPAEGNDLCRQCHASKHLGLSLHAPSAQGLCGACHQPHASAHPALLRLDPTETCLTCHPAKRSEPVATDPGQCGATQRGCSTCHDPHQAADAKLLKGGTEQATCLRCHDRPVRRTHSQEALPGVAGRLARASTPAQLHGPLREGRCSGCHQPHGTHAWRRLRRPMPQGSYATNARPATHALCFDCHDARLTTQAVLLEPAVPGGSFALDGGVLSWPGVTAFRNGDDNLHARHLGQQDKGRTCRFCHDVHTASGRGLVRDTASLGDWEFRLRFEASPTGGSCWPGCHARRAYDVSSKQENVR